MDEGGIVPAMDGRLGWRSEHDSRSLGFPIRTLIGALVLRRKSMWPAPKPRIDQGREGACVGFGWTNELMAGPAQVAIPAPDAFALDLYREAQRNDEWPGEDYDGTSVLAGAKAVQARRYIGSYRWAFGIEDVIDTLCSSAANGGGPVVIGIPWFEDMYETRPSGLVEVGGKIVGGHCLCLTGYHPGIRLFKEGFWKRFEVVRWRNSWGPDYGVNGDGYVKVEDLDALLKSEFGGEACVPQHRIKTIG